MTNWIEEATQKGREAAQQKAQEQKIKEDAQRTYGNEAVDEGAVQKFLDPFTTPVENVASELQAEKYQVEDKGYRFCVVAEPTKYTLTHHNPGGTHVAYGRTWEIVTPAGNQMDTLRLFAIGSESTHFARGVFHLGSGGSCDADLNDEVSLRRMLGASIAKYIEVSNR